MVTTDIDVESLNRAFEERPPQEVLRWAHETFAPRVAISTSFQAAGMVILDVAQQVAPGFPAFTLDTGFLFEETLDLKRRVEGRYGIEIESVRPLLTVEEQAERYGEALYARQPDECCRMRKEEPLRRKLADLDAWVTGVRRDQAKTREDARILERHEIDGRTVIKINPLVHWTKKQVWDYILAHEIPYNPLYDQGYASIGCVPCTRPIQIGEDERAGRWAGFNKMECGIHTFTKRVDRVEEA
jgi:phosphoadenosine phosphosulfate reductase